MDCDTLHDEVKNYFTIENFGVTARKGNRQSSDDEKALKIAEESIKKVGEKYEISIPWKADIPLPSGSREMAIQRLKCLEKKLIRDKNLGNAYSFEIQKLLDKKYAMKVSAEELKKAERIWFLPHFAVLNPNKPGKVRPVFDAAAKVGGKSLNDHILCGPDWLISLFGIILKFRQHKIAVTADIREMFNRVDISDKDSYSQCFLWRNLNINEEPQVYRMKAMLFGMSSSPFLAQFVKNYNALKFESEFPEAARAIINYHYVDDYIDGANNVEEATKKALEVHHIHKAGGFELRGFISNSEEFIKKIPQELISEKIITNVDENKTSSNQRILGITWNSSTDNFYFPINFNKIDKDLINHQKIPTKRQLLQVVMSVYDPIGFLSPIVIKGRMILQKTWRSEIGWDDFITNNTFQLWKQWLDELKIMEQIKLSRLYSPRLNLAKSIETHTFCDASEEAYAAVVYLRIIHYDEIETSIVCSKARVAPLRTQTIPKLELMAAVLGARLTHTVKESLEISIEKQYLWSDSRTVIHWLNSEKKLTTFVAARKEEILELTKLSEWRWVPTKENIADECTRSIPLQNFCSSHRWFFGPSFLLKKEEYWPKISEILITVVQEINDLSLETSIDLPPIKSYYTWKRILRTTAWIRRLSNNIRNKRSKNLGPLEVEEMMWAEKQWWKKVQRECFPHDIEATKHLKKNKNGKLTNIQLILDEDEILRVLGRFDFIESFDMMLKRPVCLDGMHQYVQKMIFDSHVRMGHQGTQTVVNELKKKFWIPKIRTVVQRSIKNCIFCKKRRSKSAQPLMGQLPQDRFMINQKPFTVTGIDYFGPFIVKNGRKLEKRYGVLFTCMTSRAIHVEIAYSLTTDSCIMAIRRFLSRRGEVKTIWSDNATNFRGASKELLEALEDLNERTLKNEMTNVGISWKFIPPAAPHMGGCWERMIGCFKRSIEAILRERNPTEEVLHTVFAEAEYIVNSRPLTYSLSENGELSSISPNDILICQSVRVPKSGIFDKNDEIFKKQWRISQYLADLFWQRFVKEYIPTLHTRKKWTADEKDITVGEIVQIGDKNFSRSDWPIGIVTKVFPGLDQKVRVAEIRTSSGIYRRPVVKLYRLNLFADEKESVPGGEVVTTIC